MTRFRTSKPQIKAIAELSINIKGISINRTKGFDLST
jgi:hypothetical protein